MGEFFDDIHAMPDSQLGGAPCRVADSSDTAAARGAEDFDGLGRLAKALNFQLRYREALDVYAQMLRLRPDDYDTLRARAPREINTLQPRRAIEDLLRCRALGGDEADLAYRLGIAYYLAGSYAAAMREEAACFPLVDDEMGVAVIYWHTMAALKSGAEPVLLREKYHAGMRCGHHTAYDAAVSFCAGLTPRDTFFAAMERTDSDLDFSMLAYGASVFLLSERENEESDRLRKAVVARDGFWISYANLAAWNDEYMGGTANEQFLRRS